MPGVLPYLGKPDLHTINNLPIYPQIPAKSYIIKTYKHDGLPPGVCRVAVRSGSFGSGDPFGREKTDDLIDQRPAAPTKPAVFVPEKYSDVNTNGLSATVKRGENAPFEFNLK